MDLKIIEQKQMVERYLLGRLTPPEARFFEQVVRKSPELAERMGLPDALKRTMHLLDETGSEWRERPPRFWHNPTVPLALAGALALALALAVAFWLGKREVAGQYAELRAEVETGMLAAPTRTQTLRLEPGLPGEQVPTYDIGTRVGPTLAELRIDVSHLRNTLYRATIKRDDGTYWAHLDNLLRDTNGVLRVGLNSGAFAAGTYTVELEAVTLRGRTAPAGKLRLRVAPR